MFSGFPLMEALVSLVLSGFPLMEQLESVAGEDFSFSVMMNGSAKDER